MKNIIGVYNPYGLIQKAGKVQTRSRSKKLRTRKQVYRSRIKHSPCRGQTINACKPQYGCKKTKSGTRKSYCRKNKNRHI